MRKIVLRLAALAGVLLTIGACADSPTQSDQQRAPDLAAPAQDEQLAPQGCVIDGLCVLPPISGGWCEPWMELDGDCSEDDCMSSVGDLTDSAGATVQGCPVPGTGGDPGGGGTPTPPGGDPGTVCPTSESVSCPVPPDSMPVCEVDCPPDGEDEEESDICPQPLLGRTLTTLVNVAGRNHEFKFSGTLNRVNRLQGRSPAWYEISGPTVSNDSWWIAESGNIQLVCWGRWRFRNSVWIGVVAVQDTDLHMVMGPGHPDFENQPPYPPVSPTESQ
jgi:hypothetical protein